MIVILIVYIIRVRIYKSHFLGIGHITKEFPFLSVIKKKDFFDRNASTKQSFHIDRRGMNFVNRFLANSSSYWSWLVPACWEFSFLSEPDPFLDRLLKHLLIPHVLSEPPTHSITCLWLQPFPEKGETRESSAPVHVTNRTSLGPEFCEPPDLDQDLHYVVRYIDPKNLLSVVSHPFCFYLKWC